MSSAVLAPSPAKKGDRTYLQQLEERVQMLLPNAIVQEIVEISDNSPVVQVGGDRVRLDLRDVDLDEIDKEEFERGEALYVVSCDNVSKPDMDRAIHQFLKDERIRKEEDSSWNVDAAKALVGEFETKLKELIDNTTKKAMDIKPQVRIMTVDSGMARALLNKAIVRAWFASPDEGTREYLLETIDQEYDTIDFEEEAKRG
jgi:hypothetical protein